MKFSLKLLESSKEIQDKILEAMLPEIKKIMNDGIKHIKNNLSSIVELAIKDSPEYDSLISGKLKYEFGIADSNIKLSSLLTAWTSNIIYNYQQPMIRNGKIKSSFSANMIRVDFSDVLYADFSSVVDIERGYTLPWLEWLLLEGNRTIIKNYEVIFGPSRFSRTGLAIMSPSSRSWKVPSEFSGTMDDNWITRAIDRAEPSIQKLLDEAFS